MRTSALVGCAVAAAACGRATPPPSPAPAPAAPSAPAVARADASVPRAALVLAATPSTRVFVTPRGAVAVGPDRAHATAVELAQLSARLAAASAPVDTWTPPPEHPPPGEEPSADQYPGKMTGTDDGMMWLRVDRLVDRPALVADAGVPAIRVFEVAAAAQPRGVALEVVDPTGATRALAFRVADPSDHESTIINDPIEIKIDREAIHVSGPTEPARDLALAASARDVAAAVVAVAPSRIAMIRWGMVELVDPKAPIAIAITAIEGLAAASVSGVSFLAGKPGIPKLELVTQDPASRRHLLAMRPRLLACYATWLADHPDRDGRVELAWSVGANGVASDVRATQVGLDDSVGRCIAAVLADAHMPGVSGPITARIMLDSDGGTPPSSRHR